LARAVAAVLVVAGALVAVRTFHPEPVFVPDPQPPEAAVAPAVPGVTDPIASGDGEAGAKAPGEERAPDGRLPEGDGR
jgi:hypothetical protein